MNKKQLNSKAKALFKTIKKSRVKARGLTSPTYHNDHNISPYYYLHFFFHEYRISVFIQADVISIMVNSSSIEEVLSVTEFISYCLRIMSEIRRKEIN